MIHPFILDKMPGLNNIFRQHHIKTAFLFGSACSSSFNEESDIDILIEPGDEPDPVAKGENLWDLYYALTEFLKRDVDLITRQSLTNKYFIREIDRTAVSIYG